MTRMTIETLASTLSGTAWTPTQPSFLEFTDVTWLTIALKVALVIALALTVPLVVGYMEHKVMGHQQARLGPMEAGPHGTLQLVADGIKFVQKEDIIPSAADRRVFALAPGLALVPAILTFFVIPLGPNVWAADLELGLFYALAIGSISTLGVLMGGWASANKFSLIGGIRAAAQLIAYELPLILAAAAVALHAGSLSLVEIVDAQVSSNLLGTPISTWYVIPQALGFAIFFVAAMAELSRPPFDMPIADSELVFGYMTEYSGIKFAMYLLTEYGGMVSMSALMAVLYLGGWEILPGVGVVGCEATAGDCSWWAPFVGVGVMLGKIMLLSFVMVWARVAWPRLREDQLQKFSWLVLVPLSLLNLFLVAIGKVAF